MSNEFIVGGVDGDPFVMPTHPVPPPVLFSKPRTYFVSFAWMVYNASISGGVRCDVHHGSILIQSPGMTAESVTELTARLTSDMCSGNQATILFWQELS